jgi:hypothetical protein
MKEHKILWYPWYSGLPDQEGEYQALEGISEEPDDSTSPSGSSDEHETGAGNNRPAPRGLADQVKELNLW